MGDLIFIHRRVGLSIGDYTKRIRAMDKLGLMEEMVRFQETRSSIGHLTPEMMLNGKVLFKALTEAAETKELKLLAGSYCRHLEYEYQEYLKTGKA